MVEESRREGGSASLAVLAGSAHGRRDRQAVLEAVAQREYLRFVVEPFERTRCGEAVPPVPLEQRLVGYVAQGRRVDDAEGAQWPLGRERRAGLDIAVREHRIRRGRTSCVIAPPG